MAARRIRVRRRTDSLLVARRVVLHRAPTLAFEYFTQLWRGALICVRRQAIAESDGPRVANDVVRIGSGAPERVARVRNDQTIEVVVVEYPAEARVLQVLDGGDVAVGVVRVIVGCEDTFAGGQLVPIEL